MTGITKSRYRGRQAGGLGSRCIGCLRSFRSVAIAPRLDDTDPAIPALRLEAFPSSPQTLIVLTLDSQLHETLRNVAGGHAIVTVDSEAELASQLMHAQGGVALIDAAAASSPITTLTERLKAQFPEMILVVAGSTDDQGALTPQITRGTVYRFLHKPLSEQRVKLFVAAAWRRHGEEHSGIVGALRTQTTRTLPVARNRKPWWIAIVAALVVGGAVWWLAVQPPPTPQERSLESARSPQAAPSESVPSPPAEAATSSGLITRDLEPRPAVQVPQPSPVVTQSAPPVPLPAETPPAKAKASPATSAASAQSAPAPADAGPSALAARIVAEARNALSEGKLDEAERLIQIAAEAGVDEEELDDLVRKAREQRIAARGSAMTRLSQLFSERLGQGKLFDPPDDSAKHYLAELVATDPDHPSTRSARDAFAARLVQEARSATAAEDVAAARRWLAEARSAGADESAVAGVDKEIAASQEAATKAGEIVTSTSLNKLRHVDPEYPSAARSRDLAGWVDLELTVQTDGSVGDVAVIRAEPANIFDKAAIDAVRQWRYEPVQRNGKPVEQRTRVRIRFQLQ